MNDLTVLREIEALKQLKARYCRLLDAKDWSAWRALFADDFISDTTPSGGKYIEGADAFVAFVRRTLGSKSRVTVHQVHAPELELTSASTARGVWALHDIVRLLPGLTLHGYGHYHEVYEKQGEQWRFKSATLTRLSADLKTPILSIRLPMRR